MSFKRCERQFEVKRGPVILCRSSHSDLLDPADYQVTLRERGAFWFKRPKRRLFHEQAFSARQSMVHGYHNEVAVEMKNAVFETGKSVVVDGGGRDGNTATIYWKRK
jgi:hypothetical protein